MKVLVGLGNPGLEYERTRHNAGWMAIDLLARRHAGGAVARGRFSSAALEASVGGERCLLLKPLTFMNRSGQAVGEAVRFYKLDPAEDLLVLYDEVDLPVGSVRVRVGGGDNGHNGIADVDRALGGASCPRVRIGVGSTPRLMKRADWVLSRFMDEERAEVEAGIALAADAAEVIVAKGVTEAMNRFNKKVAVETPPDHPNDTKRATGPGATNETENDR